ncbi:nucleotide exchange factor GrpE [Xiamenia xianingshaonis]|uniref:Protein GrpE n=1 Tax=Xiamenia xianingshaonis TaxID=2682776 RepID=A0A9E6SUH7_9ACTN|nr:nucleotide exchange factor GrpE [Xiamenia xianingshaonis]NHM13864.1 nucleotide exchange factor GrpE [Xiamenia xianingshaonis]NHM15090.1 nucleotide exchange factor GrpE [Xiamenia xianingshaonis]QTU84444.1 nucleotide exchange factor GrpE [Xiamenia xianingshaonis]
MTPSKPNQERTAPGASSAQDEAQQAGTAQPAGADATSADETAEAVVIDAEPSEGEEADAELSAEEAAEKAIEDLRAEKQAWEDRYLRLHAEWDTYRRRTAEQREAEKARATEKLVTDLIPVIDDFERTIAYADEHGEQGLLDGVKAVYSKLGSVLERSGVVVLNPVNEPFNALDAQAVATVEDSSAYDETVRDVYQKGYKMGMKVLRPAMVTVTCGGPKREPAPAEDADQQ